MIPEVLPLPPHCLHVGAEPGGATATAKLPMIYGSLLFSNLTLI